MTKGVDFYEQVSIDPFDIHDRAELAAHIEKLATAPIPRETKATASKGVRIPELSDDELQAIADAQGKSLDEIKLLLSKMTRGIKAEGKKL